MATSAQPLWLLILSLSITGSIVGTVIAAVANGLSDRSRRRFELQKWRAEFYVRPKVEAFRNLHAAMVRAHYEINMRAKARMPQSVQEYREQVETVEMDFFRAHTLAQIYYDADTGNMMRAVLGSVRQMTTSIWLRLPENQGQSVDVELREPDWKPFSDLYDVAQERLGTILHPNELIKWAEGER
ncbi:MAG: hypothetical protein JO166_22265 [Deltaproteobacteria bacterium]|nr:hypothetical protein [Deltaproteobacteria bacterium]